MAINIPATVLDGLNKWLESGNWSEHIADVYKDHLYGYREIHDFDTYDELSAKIGQHWGITLRNVITMSFLSRETKSGNVIDVYLKRRGWKEKSIPKAYLKAVRNSVMTLYEVSDIRPGVSFLARDLFMGGDPILVEERIATKSMLPWENFAMRIVDVRGHNIIAGGLLPYDPELAEQVIDKIYQRALILKYGTGILYNEVSKIFGPKKIQDIILDTVLKLSDPVFSEEWLMATEFDPGDVKLPTLIDTNGDLGEFVRLRYSFAIGATQNQLRELLNDAPDMDAASSEIWNWVAPPAEESEARPKQAGTLTYQVHMDSGAAVPGTVKLKGNKLEVDVNSTEWAEKLQERLKDILGDLVSKPFLLHQSVKQAIAEDCDRPAPNEQLELSPEVESQILKNVYDQRYRRLLDEPLSMLDGSSPRAAVKTPEGEKNVVKWMKILETSEARVRQSKPVEPYDFLWMWQELGIAKLRK